MTTSNWPDWLENVWAKSPERGQGGQAESLPRHTWEVLGRLAELIRLRPGLPERFGANRFWHILFWAAFLHDFGKAAGGFQAQLRGGPKWPHRHEVLSLAFVDWASADLTPAEQSLLIAGIVSHHKDAAEIQALYPPPDDFAEDQLLEAVAEMDKAALQGLWDWLDQCSAAWIAGLGLSAGAGVSALRLPDRETAVDMIRDRGPARIRHRLTVYRRFVRDLERRQGPSRTVEALTMRGTLINADHLASAHAGPLPRAAFDVGPILAGRGLSPNTLFAHQSALAATEGNALLRAPTGSGKTEAALLWAACQAAKSNGGLPRLFYTLPYQASMNAMKVRLEESFPNMVGLQHGRALLALYRLLLDSDHQPQEAARRARWARSLAHLNYPPVRVFSPYQMLKGMYRLKGYEALLADFHDGAFVLDEIHAYEVKRLALILKTMQYLGQNFGARFLVMSATFPTLIRQWLRQALDNPEEVQADAALFDQFKRHRLALLDGELPGEDGLDRIVREAEGGKPVLVVCNLVDRAQEVHRRLNTRLEAAGVPVRLLHGRFNMRDRSAREKTVREAAGSTSRQRRPIVLVATQVIEVSLDIDLAVIYTEPAPLEALIQRFGRINRRRLQPDLAPVYVFRQPLDGQSIYDPELIARTMTVLQRENGRPIDESAVGHWLDEIYSGAVADRWNREYTLTAAEFDTVCVHALRPFTADRKLADLFYRAFDSIQVLPASLRGEYSNLKEQDPILAEELLVSISWQRYCALARQGLATPQQADMPPVVNADYDPETGLVFCR